LLHDGARRHAWAGHAALVRFVSARGMDPRCGSTLLARRALANLRTGEIAHASAAPPRAAGFPVAHDDPGVPVHCSARVRLGSPLLT